MKKTSTPPKGWLKLIALLSALTLIAAACGTDDVTDAAEAVEEAVDNDAVSYTHLTLPTIYSV